MKAKLNFSVRITENVTRISPSKIAKSGWLIVLEREAEATKFIRSSTSIPIPEVYGIQQSVDHPEKGELIMEFIPGDPLHVAWPKLTKEQQASVISQLRSYIHRGNADSSSASPWLDRIMLWWPRNRPSCWRRLPLRTIVFRERIHRASYERIKA